MKRFFDDLSALLGNRSEQRVILDFAAVKFIASAMLGMLVAFQETCQEFRAKLKLVRVSPDSLQVFKITKLNKVSDTQYDEATARNSFNGCGFHEVAASAA